MFQTPVVPAPPSQSMSDTAEGRGEFTRFFENPAESRPPRQHPALMTRLIDRRCLLRHRHPMHRGSHSNVRSPTKPARLNRILTRQWLQTGPLEPTPFTPQSARFPLLLALHGAKAAVRGSFASANPQPQGPAIHTHFSAPAPSTQSFAARAAERTSAASCR